MLKFPPSFSKLLAFLLLLPLAFASMPRFLRKQFFFCMKNLSFLLFEGKWVIPTPSPLNFSFSCSFSHFYSFLTKKWVGLSFFLRFLSPIFLSFSFILTFFRSFISFNVSNNPYFNINIISHPFVPNFVTFYSSEIWLSCSCPFYDSI